MQTLKSEASRKLTMRGNYLGDLFDTTGTNVLSVVGVGGSV